MDGIKTAISRLLRVYNREAALDNALREIGPGHGMNYHFENWSEVVDAICYIVGGSPDKLIDSDVYKILLSTASDANKVEQLMDVYEKTHGTTQPAPHIMDRQEVIAMVRDNGGYISPDGRQS